MDGIAKTAYYCCGVRMLDAQREHPLCGDQLAARFMDGEALAYFEHFRRFTLANAGNAARHRIIDDLLRERLRNDPANCIVLLGAGFDTRAFRLRGGTWWEFDQPALIERKEAVLPQAQAPNPLLRVGIDFAVDRLEDRMAPLRGTASAVVVLEGVCMYLERPALAQTLVALQRLLPGHALACDLMNAAFVRRVAGAVRSQVASLGARFATTRADPAAEFLERGYRLASSQSIALRTMELGGVRRFPPWVMGTLLRSLRDGYRVCMFQAP